MHTRWGLTLALLLITGCARQPPPVTYLPTPPPEPWLLEMRCRVPQTDIWAIVSADGRLFAERIEVEYVKHVHQNGPVDWEQRMHYFHSVALSGDQLQELQTLLAGFDQLSDEPYGGPEDGPYIELASGPKLVTGRSEAPVMVWTIRERLWHLVRNAPVVYAYTPDIDEDEVTRPGPWGVPVRHPPPPVGSTAAH